MEVLNNFLLNAKFFIQNFSFKPNLLQAGALVVLLFLLVVSMASFRKHFVHWSIKGGLIGLFFGFLLTLLLEGFLLIGGKTALIEVLGWKNPPKPVRTALDLGKDKLIGVLGVKDEIPISNASEGSSLEDAINVLQSLNPDESKKIKAIICTP